ncbi:MAG: ABC transporter substrate-binding protein [Candidatus Bipolaricaulaceae bacterium]
MVLGGWIRGIPDVFQVIILVGRTVGREERAQRLVGRLAQEMGEVEGAVLERPRPKAAFLYLPSPEAVPYAAGRGTPEHELLVRAGGENVFSDLQGYAQISLEEVLLRDPLVIFTDPTQAQNFEKKAILAELRAVKEGKVVGIPASWIVSTRVAEALRKAAVALHPEAFGP